MASDFHEEYGSVEQSDLHSHQEVPKKKRGSNSLMSRFTGSMGSGINAGMQPKTDVTKKKNHRRASSWTRGLGLSGGDRNQDQVPSKSSLTSRFGHRRSSSWAKSSSSGSTFSLSRLKQSARSNSNKHLEEVMNADTDSDLLTTLQSIRPGTLNNNLQSSDDDENEYDKFGGSDDDQLRRKPSQPSPPSLCHPAADGVYAPEANEFAVLDVALDVIAPDEPESALLSLKSPPGHRRAKSEPAPVEKSDSTAKEILRATSLSPPPRPAVIIRTVVITRSSLDVPLGLRIITRSTEHVDGTIMNVKTITSDGAAAACMTEENKLEIGDRILRINDFDLVLQPEAEVMSLLNRTKLTFLVVPDPKWLIDHNDEPGMASKVGGKLSTLLKTSLSMRLWNVSTDGDRQDETPTQIESNTNDEKFEKENATIMQVVPFRRENEEFMTLEFEEVIPEAWLIGGDGLITQFITQNPPPSPEEINRYIQSLLSAEVNPERIRMLKQCSMDLGLSIVDFDSSDEDDSDCEESGISRLGSSNISTDSEASSSSSESKRKRGRARRRRLSILRDILQNPLDDDEIGLFLDEDDFGAEGRLHFESLSISLDQTSNVIDVSDILLGSCDELMDELLDQQTSANGD